MTNQNQKQTITPAFKPATIEQVAIHYVNIYEAQRRRARISIEQFDAIYYAAATGQTAAVAD